MGAAAGGVYRSNVTAVLQSMQRLRLKVLRTWAFNDGSGKWQGLQISPGQYDERVFRCADGSHLSQGILSAAGNAAPPHSHWN